MDAPRPPEPPRPDPGPAWGPSVALLAVALGLVVGAVAWWWSASAEETRADAAPAAAPAAVPIASLSPPPAAPVPAAAAASAVLPMAAAPPAAPRIRRARDPNGDQTPDLSDYVNEGERPTMAHVIEQLHRSGVRGGIAAFPVPGTRPPLVGLAVPEGVVLPDGYVRHYQATDDGQRIEPILMYAPGRDFFDAAGRPIEVPKDRVVPPESAPPGIPLRRIAIPAPLDTGKPGS